MHRNPTKEPLPEPPPKLFRIVRFEPLPPLAAYLSPNPEDDTKHPAIVWITGGDCNTIGNVWDGCACEQR